mmetsp:Transcript_31546/g.87977  ORF Transcript_31546/g.87977 Transcript_31546/m.87977 type:complete len:485 (-) Transcript_31546:12-1466(-)
MISSVRASLPNIATAKQLHKNDGASRRRGERPRATPCMARSLRGALHALAAAALAVAVAVVCLRVRLLGLPPAFCLGRQVHRAQLHHIQLLLALGVVLVLIVAHLRVCLGARRERLGQDRLERLHRLRIKAAGGRELHLELDEEVAVAVGRRVLRHARVGHAQDAAVADDLAGLALDEQVAAVGVLDNELGACERLDERDVLLHDQVRLAPHEGRVLLLLHHKHQVARLRVRVLVALAAERDLLAVLHALLDRHLDHLAALGHLVAAAVLAPRAVLEVAAAAAALGAGLLDLLDHGAHAPNHEHRALAIAARADRLRCPLLRAAARAGRAQGVARDRELARVPLRQLLERALHRVHAVARLAPPRPAAATKTKHGRQVGPAAPAVARALHGLLAPPVVGLALGLVAQHLVRLRGRLELGLVAALVRVLLGRNLHEGLLDVLGCRVLGHAQRLIVRIRVHLLRLIGLAAHAPKGETSATEKHAST